MAIETRTTDGLDPTTGFLNRKNRLYVVYDRVANDISPVFECLNNNVARRAFLQQIKNTNPDDFWLLCIGELLFEGHRIKLIPFELPENIMITVPQEETYV